MAFCYFAKGEENSGYIMMETDFINSYMPDLSSNSVKVYLYGLYLCSMPLSRDNTIEHIMDALSFSQEKIIDSFNELQEKGLVTIHSYDPLSIQYHSTKNRGHFKTYNKEKYADFNRQLEEAFSDKLIANPNTYTQYYDFIESSHIEPDALSMIIRHCVHQKGTGVSHSYILKVASSWVNNGLRTVKAIEDRILQFERNMGTLKDIAVAIGKTSEISEEDKELYIKWTSTWNFDNQAILAACKKSLKTMIKLDSILDECQRNAKFSAQEIESYLKNKKKLTELAISIVQKLGIWYDNAAPVVETYVNPWLIKGFSSDALLKIADYCFKNSIKKLEQMDNIVNSLHSQGIVNDQQINQHFESMQKTDQSIKELLSILGLSRIVTISDRDSFKCWTKEWGFPIDTIQYIASICVGGNIGDVSRKLATLKENGRFSKEDALSFYSQPKTTKAAKELNASDRKYNKEQAEASLLNAIDILNTEA